MIDRMRLAPIKFAGSLAFGYLVRAWVTPLEGWKWVGGGSRARPRLELSCSNASKSTHPTYGWD